MRVLAYCAKTFQYATKRASGVVPLTSPPVTADSFDPKWLEGYDLLYFDLHGEPGKPFWLGEDEDESGFVTQPIALTADQVRQANLKGAIVFAATCYLADADSPMLDALLDAGARYVIGGDGVNWGSGQGRRGLLGTTLLGRWLREMMNLSIEPLDALALAKVRLRVALAGGEVTKNTGRIEAARDTLAFRAYHRGGEVETT